MKPYTNTPQDQFVIDISHAFSRYGVVKKKDETISNFRMRCFNHMTSNWGEIESQIDKLEFFYDRND